MDTNKHYGAWLWLAALTSVSAKKKNLLLDHFGSPEAIGEADEKSLLAVKGIGPETVAHLRATAVVERGKKAEEFTAVHGIGLLTRDEMPQRLREIYDPPVTLFYKGRRELFDRELMIGIVGCRRASPVGLKHANTFGRDLGNAGFTVVSGLAEGIDARAHQGALASIGSTIAFLGTGINICYPEVNHELYMAMAEEGLLVSEYFLDEPPQAFHFPVRNRLIAGLSQGLLVVEAGKKSGALITADLAAGLGRNVYALPGDIDKATSVGTNRLIQDGATLVTSVRDIMADYVLLQPKQEVGGEAGQEEVRPLPEGDEGKVLNLILSGQETVDDLLLASGLEMQQLNTILSSLEIDGLISVKFNKISVLS